MKLEHLPDETILSGVAKLLGSERRALAQLIAHLVEVDSRRLYAKAACPSLFEFCLRRLGLSEGEAFRRMTAARLVRRFPSILGRIERGEIHLSALVLLRRYLTEENHAELLELASRKTKGEVEKAIARRFPKPDVRPSIRKLPSVRTASARTTDSLSCAPATATVPAPTTPSAIAPASTRATCGDAAMSDSASVANGCGSPNVVAASTTTTTSPVDATLPARLVPPRPTVSQTVKSRVEPLSEARYKLQLTIDAALRAKLERATELMSHRNPDAELTVILDRALDVLIARLEKEKLGMTERPQERRRSAKLGYVTRAVRREVIVRDGGQCTFVDANGRRCEARSFLELDHIHARALGGTGDAANIRLRCRTHNRLHAEETFGRDHVERRIHSSRCKADAMLHSARAVVTPESRDSVGDGGTCTTKEASAHSPHSAYSAHSPLGSAFDRARAMHALVELGFREREVHCALDVVEQRIAQRAATRPASTIRLEDVVREAVAVLSR